MAILEPTNDIVDTLNNYIMTLILGLPTHELKLKIGVPVMLFRNIDQQTSLCNDTRLIITHMGTYVLEAKVISQSSIAQKVYIPRLSLTPSDPRIPFNFQRKQFPIVVSFAVTINISEGQSLQNVGIYLPKPVFSHGQLYVAVSRAGLKLLICDDDDHVSNKTYNVIYKEIFQNLR
ncbi:uncharacterized protein LOC131657686 [Vicia villosa]|uniref:uncharacterized protein LOC131657686 n=1 Tax=Vicia villosa TaxID=3911 RepID=UPI00273B6965|nr:uncharacterized protein LOC131657686 [Vicia villosa]